MFDKRLLRELNQIPGFRMKVTAATLAAVALIVLQCFLLARGIDQVLQQRGSRKDLVIYGFLLCTVIAVRGIIGFGMEYYYRRSAIRIKEGLRVRLVEGAIAKGPIRLKKDSPAILATTLQDGVENTEAYYTEYIPQFITVVLSILVILPVTFFTDWISGIVMLVTAPLTIVFMILIGKTGENVSKKQWKTLQKMGVHFLDILKGIATLRLFGKLERQRAVVEEMNEVFRENTMAVLRITFLSALVLEMVATISTALVAVSLGIRLLYGHIDFFHSFFILLLAPEYYQPIRQLGAKFHAAMGAKTAADSIYQLLETEVDQKFHDKDQEEQSLQQDRSDNDCLQSNKAEQDVIDQSIKRESFGLEDNYREKLSGIADIPRISDDMKYDLEIRNLSFSYSSKEKEVLEKLNIEIPTGSHIALVGPSGAGKSTLVHLLMGFMKGYNGSIRLGGQELKDCDPNEWRENFAFVPQNPRIFKGTLWENLTMAKPSVSKDAVDRIVELLGLDKLKNQLTGGYEGMIGEGGAAVSGGQAQLISIARAALKDTKLVILDEPSSALDVETESLLREAIKKLFTNKTVITIAHRIATIKEADCVFYLDKGKVCEKGSHEQLMENRGAFFKVLQVWEDFE